VMMFSNDKEKLSEQLLKLFKGDRAKQATSRHLQHAYQSQALKFLSTKEKEGESSYRVTYVSFMSPFK
jgi:hypothetical protein